MFENILESVQHIAGQAVEQSPDVDNAHKEGIAGEAVASIKNGIQGAIANGNVSSLLGFFSNSDEKAESNPVVQGISGDFISNITQKFGLGNGASSLSAIIPMIFNLVKSHLSGAGGGNAATASSEGGLGGILGSFSGILDQNKDGKVDLSDASGLLGSLGSLFGGK
ncbi:MAG: hypothetical protein QM610_13440 [Chitinophagaceae bacterium]